MNYNGIVRGFFGYTPEQRKRLSEDLSLSFSDDTLRLCMTYYRKAEKREPYIDELQSLSYLFSQRSNSPAHCTLTEVFTNDSYVVSTYSDLLRKRNELDFTQKEAPTLPDLGNTVSRYLMRAAGTENIRREAFDITHTEKANAFNNCACSSHWRLHTTKKDLKLISGDILVLLMPRVGEDASKTAETLFQLPSASLIKKVYTVSDKGLLPTLVDLFSGIAIDLCAFSPEGGSIPLTELCTRYGGYCLIRTAKEDLTKLLQAISASEFFRIPFARITEDGRFSFHREEGASFSLQAHFLKMLCKHRKLSAQLPSESEIVSDTVLMPLYSGKKEQLIQKEEAVYASALTSPAKAFFKTATYTALAPSLLLCAHGISFDKQTLVPCLELPEEFYDAKTVGKAVSLLLGLYRAQAELALYSQPITIKASSTCTSPSLTVFSAARAENDLTVRETDSDAPLKIYCVTIPSDTEGYPDFATFRSFGKELVALAREIEYAYVLIGESIASALERTPALRLKAGESAILFGTEKIPFGILFASKKELPFRVAVALTLEDDANEIASKSSFEELSEDCLDNFSKSE